MDKKELGLTKAGKPRKRKPRKGEGQPTAYRVEYCQALYDYFDCEPYREVETPHYDKSGSGVVIWTETKTVPNRYPTLRDFAHKIGVGTRTVYDWIDPKHGSYQPKFSQTFTQAQVLRKEFLIHNGLLGLHNPAYAKFVAVNCTDMRDKVDTEMSGTMAVTIVDYCKVDADE